MKTKFAKFVKENWSRGELDSFQWDDVENIGSVLFKDGIELWFEYEGMDFIQVEG